MKLNYIHVAEMCCVVALVCVLCVDWKLCMRLLETSDRPPVGQLRGER